MSHRVRGGRSQRGVALITAMILVALATVIAATLFFESAMTARRSAASFSMEQAIDLAQGAEGLAAFALSQDTNRTDSMRDPWGRHLDPVEVAPEVSIEVQMTDEQGKFNLNTLLMAKDGAIVRNPDAAKVFTRLLQLLELDPKWTGLLIDWMDGDSIVDQDGGEDSLYASQKPPHRTANLMLTSISELQQMPGFNRELYQRLAPFVTALPPRESKINICTADREVLDALYAVTKVAQDVNNVEYTKMQPQDLAKTRKEQDCFPTVDVFTHGDLTVKSFIEEKSSYFRLHTWVRIGTAQFTLYSLMYREGSEARAISRTFGTE